MNLISLEDKAQYNSNDSLIQSNIENLSELNTTYTQTNDSSLHETLENEIKNSVDQVRTLANANNEILESFIDSRKAIANTINTENSAITTSELIESNLQQVNNIYLSTIAAGINSFTDEQKQVLHDISIQCPYAGGPGVYQARSLYSIVDNQIVYNDIYNCAQLGYYRLKNNNKDISIKSIKIIPNPVQNKAKLVYQLSPDSKGSCYIYNANGSLILLINLLANTTNYEFDTEVFKSGIYHYRVSSDGNYVGSGNFAVIK